jgi:Acetyltransferase (GNAT) domain
VPAEQDWPIAEAIDTQRLTLEPLRPEHATELAPLLDDADLHRYIGGHPATPDELRRRYALQAVGHSPDGREGWLNWIARDRASGAAVGTVQATLSRGSDGLSAELAWVIATRHQQRGYAREAAAEWSGGYGGRVRTCSPPTCTPIIWRPAESPNTSASRPPRSSSTARPAGPRTLDALAAGPPVTAEPASPTGPPAATGPR